MSNRKKLQAIFFDFDGVIVDSTTVKTAAFRTLFAPYPEILDRVIEHHLRYGGISRVEKIRWAHSELLGSPLSEEALAVEAKRYSELVLDAVVGVPYVPGALEFLQNSRREHPEILLFVVSGTPQPELREVTRRRNLDQYFVEVLGSTTHKPELVRQQLKKHNLQKENCVFIGDALTDYETARATDLGFVGIQRVNRFPEGTVTLPDCTGLAEVLL